MDLGRLVSTAAVNSRSFEGVVDLKCIPEMEVFVSSEHCFWQWETA